MGAPPILSVVVTVVSDTSKEADLRHLEACLEALNSQVDAPAMEVLVTWETGIPGLEKVQARFPDVLIACIDARRRDRLRPSREHHDTMRGAALRMARAPIIGFLEDHDRPDLHWCAQLVKEHAAPYAAIGGAVENEVNRALNWAVYFCDFARYQNPVRRGPADSLTDANVSYKRTALDRVAGAWAETYNEVTLHAAFKACGETLYLSPDVVVYQHRLDLRLGRVLEERYVWGRSYGAVRSGNVSHAKRAILGAFAPLVPIVLLLKQAGNVLRTRRNRGAFLRALPLTILLDVVWAWGELVGNVTGRAA